MAELTGQAASDALTAAFRSMLAKAKKEATMFSNGLTPAEDERLAILLEEMGEAIQIIGKIQRHGYESFDPTKTESPTNRKMLEKELGDVVTGIAILAEAKDVDQNSIMRRVKPKLTKLLRYVHHNIDLIEKLVKQQ